MLRRTDDGPEERILMTEDPKISFLCPSFNHGRYVSEFVRSVLAQTCSDWELVLVDDASTDDNLQRLADFEDPRIRVVRHAYNQGINAALADALGLARAPICSLIASDDQLEASYVEVVLREMRERPDGDVGFVQLSRMTANGRLTGKVLGRVPLSVRDRLFERFFLDGAGFVSPGMVVRTSALRKILPFPRGICQRQDQLMEFQLAFSHSFFFIDRPLVRYRQCGEGISTISDASSLRLAAESFVLMDEISRLFKTDADLRRCFPSVDFFPKRPIEMRHILFWLGRIALTSRLAERKVWGLSAIMQSMRTKEMQDDLQTMFGYSFADYMRDLERVPLKPSRERRKIRQLRGQVLFVSVLCILSWLAFCLMKFFC